MLSSREYAEVVHLEKYQDCFSKQTKKAKGDHGSYSFIRVWRDARSIYVGSFIVCDVFIDDFPRKTWIFFMKTKDEVFGQSELNNYSLIQIILPENLVNDISHKANIY